MGLNCTTVDPEVQNARFELKVLADVPGCACEPEQIANGHSGGENTKPQLLQREEWITKW
jgi:hypothetical protein